VAQRDDARAHRGDRDSRGAFPVTPR
jgi:hypothetical protein